MHFWWSHTGFYGRGVLNQENPTLVSMIIDILPVIAYTLQLLPEIIPQIFPYQTKYAVHIVKLSERNHFIAITQIVYTANYGIQIHVSLN